MDMMMKRDECMADVIAGTGQRYRDCWANCAELQEDKEAQEMKTLQ